jgi:hypothetical protein
LRARIGDETTRRYVAWRQLFFVWHGLTAFLGVTFISLGFLGRGLHNSTLEEVAIRGIQVGALLTFLGLIYIVYRWRRVAKAMSAAVGIPVAFFGDGGLRYKSVSSYLHWCERRRVSPYPFANRDRGDQSGLPGPPQVLG